MTDDFLSYKYIFQFDSGHTIDFEIKLDRRTLDYQPPREQIDSDWSVFNELPCSDCYQTEADATCPVTRNIAYVVQAFNDVASYTKVNVMVVGDERTISHDDLSVQQALSSLLGIIMVTSGCKDLDKLRPISRLHLPFASIEETIFRASAIYLLAQYYRKKCGLEPDWDLEKMPAIYSRIDSINTQICKRLREVSSDDANMNAIIVLDTMAQMMPHSIEAGLPQFEGLFAAHLKDD
ncbi:MAG: hypothetical protein KAU50_05675 [Candidatus Marinimicrobia bacterium]|nr:hypothetical protein [Candidatus Neomarinimicrobiota bacterium]